MDLIEEIEKLEPSDQIRRCDTWLEENKNDNTVIAGQIKFLRRCAAELQQKDEALQQKDQQLQQKDQQHERELQQKDQQLQQKDEALQQKDQQLQQKDEIIQQKNEALEDRSLARVREKFPVVTDTSVSQPHYPENYHHADVVPLTLGDLPAEVLAAVPTKFWEAPLAEKGRNVDSEMTVVMVVDNLVTSILQGMKLDHLVETSHNKSLAGIECDLLLVHKTNRLPFAVLEIKKPGNCWDSLELIFNGKKQRGKMQNRVAGQVYAQMMAIKLFGFPTVTGMISTGNQWRIVGLRNSRDGIAGDVGQKVASYLSKTRATRSVSSPGEKVPCCDKKTEESNARLEIWGSDIVPSHEGLESKSTKALKKRVEKSGEEIVSLLVLFLNKAFSNLTDLLTRGVEPIGPSLQEGPMPCRILVNDDSKGKDDGKRRKSDVFTFGTVTLTQLELGTFNPKLTKIHVCRHLGMGDNANVCLGTSEDGGSYCAVKFYHNAQEREQLAEDECQNWTKVYGSQTHFAMPYTLEVAGGHCLVMPYLHPIQPEDRRRLLDNGEIRSALKTFAASGFIHVDMKWRHIRMWRGNQDSRIFIIDLGNGSLERRKKKVDIDKWIKKSINDLRDSGPLPCLEAQANIGKRKR